MLGWEFPPLLSGGLGVATYGMVKALRHKVAINLIIPSYGGSASLPNVNIIGLNSVSAREANIEQLHFNFDELISEVHRIPLTLSPYHHINEEILRNKLDEFDVQVTEEKKRPGNNS